MTEETGSSEAKNWINEAEAALNRTADALRAAWEGTKDSRMKTLEAAKDAASQLGKAIDEGLEVARESWGSRTETQTEPEESSEEE